MSGWCGKKVKPNIETECSKRFLALSEKQMSNE